MGAYESVLCYRQCKKNWPNDSYPSKAQRIAGQCQSPIDIDSSNTIFDPKLRERTFKFSYAKEDCVLLQNKGNTWQVNVQDDPIACNGFTQDVMMFRISAVTASHLRGLYRLKQFHCHWG